MKRFTTLIILVGLIALNILSLYVSFRLDLTREGKYSLAPATKQLLSGLSAAMTVKAYFTNDLPSQLVSIRQYVADVLQEYQAYGGRKLIVQFIDPAGNADNEKEAKALGVAPVSMQIREADSLQVKQGYFGMALFYKDKKEAIPLLQDSELNNLEYTLTSLMTKMSMEKLPTVGFLHGHGEHDIGFGLPAGMVPQEQNGDYSVVADELRKHYQVKSIDIGEGDSLDSLSLLVVAGAKKDLSRRDIFEIDQYLLKGGKAIFLVDSVSAAPNTINFDVRKTNLQTLFAPWGISIPNAIVFDRLAEFGQFSEGPGQIYMVPYPAFIWLVKKNFSQNPIVSKIQSMVVRFVNPIEIKPKDGVEADAFLNSSPDAWVQTSPFSLSPRSVPEPKPGERAKRTIAVELSGLLPRISEELTPPPLQKWSQNAKHEDVLVAVTEHTDKSRAVVETPKDPAKVIMMGDSDFATNQLVANDSISLGFFLNMVDSLALSSDLVSIRSKAFSNVPISGDLSMTQKTTLKLLGILLVPILLSSFGTIHLILRRKKSS